MNAILRLALSDWFIGFITNEMHCHTALLAVLAYEGENIRKSAFALIAIWAMTLLAQKVIFYFHKRYKMHKAAERAAKTRKRKARGRK